MRMLILMSLTTITYSMDQFLLTLVPASVAGLVAFSAGRNRQRQEETELRSDNLAILTHEFDQLKSTLAGQGMLVKGTPEIRICNPINTLFNRAIECDNKSALEMILNLCPSLAINELDESGSTALHIARRVKNTGLIEFLLEKGAKPDAPDKSGITPFHYAVDESDIESLSSMLKTDPNLITLALDENGSTALHVAVQQQNNALLRLFLDLHANPNLHNLEGKTPLHLAAQVGDPDIITSLVDAHAEVNVADAAGMTPLHYAAQTGNTAAIEILISNGAEPNMPALIALQTNMHDALKFFLELRHARAQTDTESPLDFLVNTIGLVIPAIQKLQESPLNQCADLVIRTLLERNPECSICYEDLQSEVHIASCCGKVMCPGCVSGLLNAPTGACAFCTQKLSNAPFFVYQQPALEEALPEGTLCNSNLQEASSST